MAADFDAVVGLVTTFVVAVATSSAKAATPGLALCRY
jgi:hypothetical protein